MNEQTTLDRDYLTIKQTAEYMQVSPVTVRRYIAMGKLKSSQIAPGCAVRVSAASIEKLLQGNRQ